MNTLRYLVWNDENFVKKKNYQLSLLKRRYLALLLTVVTYVITTLTTTEDRSINFQTRLRQLKPSKYCGNNYYIIGI